MCSPQCLLEDLCPLSFKHLYVSVPGFQMPQYFCDLSITLMLLYRIIFMHYGTYVSQLRKRKGVLNLTDVLNTGFSSPSKSQKSSRKGGSWEDTENAELVIAELQVDINRRNCKGPAVISPCMRFRRLMNIPEIHAGDLEKAWLSVNLAIGLQ